jgi:hypothetical protein
VATHGNSKVQKLAPPQNSLGSRREDDKQSSLEYDDEDNEESDRGSILCHERLAIVGIGESKQVMMSKGPGRISH